MTIRSTPVKTAAGSSSRGVGRLLFLLVGFFILLALPTAALAQRKTLRVSYPAPATVYLPLWIASEAGSIQEDTALRSSWSTSAPRRSPWPPISPEKSIFSAAAAQPDPTPILGASATWYFLAR